MKFLRTEVFFYLFGICLTFKPGSCDENLIQEDGNNEEKSVFSIIDKINKEEKDKKKETGVSGGEKQPKLFEVDIVDTPDLERRIKALEFESEHPDIAADAATNGEWQYAIVPYTFHTDFSLIGRRCVREAIAEFDKKTCIRWVPRTNEQYYVEFFHGGGCWSYIGKVYRSPQQISLAPGCVSWGHGTAIHEMMHALGFFHEQSRRDRDDYIKINWENIQDGKEGNFRMYRPGEASNLSEPYDTGSVMHYSSKAFSKNRKPTIVSLKNKPLGQRNGLSDIDVRQLNKYYKCPVTSTQKPKTAVQQTTTKQSQTTPRKSQPTTLPPTKKTTTQQPQTTLAKTKPSISPTSHICQDERDCINKKSSCENSRRTRMDCPVACGLCDVCKDKEDFCVFAAPRGICDIKDPILRRLVRTHCRKSCGLCWN